MKKRLSNLIGILLVLITVGCASKSAETSTDMNVSVTPSSGRLTPVEITATLSPTLTPLVTSTPIGETVEANLPTPLATLSEPEAQPTIMAYLENNGDCRFPCWWGITPGETAAEDANKIISPLGYVSYWENYMTLFYPLGVDDSGNPNVGEVRLSISDGIVISIRTSPNRYTQAANILLEYGTSTEIKLGARPLIPKEWLLRLDLYYPDLGLFFSYVDDSFLEGGEIDSELLQGCFQYPNVSFFWWPELDYSIDYALGYDSISEHRDIAEVTDLDIESLLDLISDPSDPVCIETAKEFWE